MSNTINTEAFFKYQDSDGVLRDIQGLHITQDKGGRYWLWSDQLETNLAYKADTLDDMMRIALSSLLFNLKLKQERLDTLTELKNKVDDFIASVSVNDEN